MDAHAHAHAHADADSEFEAVEQRIAALCDKQTQLNKEWAAVDIDAISEAQLRAWGSAMWSFQHNSTWLGVIDRTTCATICTALQQALCTIADFPAAVDRDLCRFVGITLPAACLWPGRVFVPPGVSVVEVRYTLSGVWHKEYCKHPLTAWSRYRRVRVLQAFGVLSRDDEGFFGHNTRFLQDVAEVGTRLQAGGYTGVVSWVDHNSSLASVRLSIVKSRTQLSAPLFDPKLRAWRNWVLASQLNESEVQYDPLRRRWTSLGTVTLAFQTCQRQQDICHQSQRMSLAMLSWMAAAVRAGIRRQCTPGMPDKAGHKVPRIV
jgi:hypothetical protein